jgi:hypothetical protein
MSLREIAALTLALTLAAGCTSSKPSDSPTDAAPCHFTLEWGARTGSTFVPFRDGDPAGVILGFQGFRYLQTSVRLRGAGTGDVDVRFQVTLEGHAAKTEEAGRFTIAAGDDGALYADGALLFFNDVPMPELLGHSAEVIVVATQGACTGTTHATVKLVTGGCAAADGGTECADAGP